MTAAESEEKEYDIVVIGGGCSGLTAAYHLKKRGKDLNILVVEAKDRLGGRVCGSLLNASHGKDSWDVGGQWVARLQPGPDQDGQLVFACKPDWRILHFQQDLGGAKSQPNVTGLISELGLKTYEQDCDGRKVLIFDNENIRYYEHTGTYGLSIFAALDVYFGVKKLEDLCSKIPVDDPLKCVYAEEWDSKTLDQAINSILWSSEGRNMLATSVFVTFGVESSQISFFYFLYFCQQCGGVAQIIDPEQPGYAQEWKVEGGAFRIVEKLAESIGNENIRLSAPVISITQDDKRAKIGLLSGEVISSKKVIIAIPPNFRAKINYLPPLPQAQRHLCERMPMGHLTKIIVTYAKRFWKEQGLSGEAIHCPVYMGAEAYPVCLTFDATSNNGSPALVLFVGGKRALDLGKLREEDQKKPIINSLVLFFGNAAAEPIDIKIKDWSKEAWNGGCPVSVMSPGSLAIYGCEALREPFDRIHWAGTETAKYWSGYIDGAVQSGYRAANEVLTELEVDFKPEAEHPFEIVNEQQVIAFKIENESRTALKRGLILVGVAVLLTSLYKLRLKSLWT